MDNKWTKFLLVFGLMVLAFIVLAISNSGGNKTKQPTTKHVKKEKVANINDRHLRDKESLYAQKDPDVITMYLTVRRGNTAENTNHSWREINQYSAYDYEKMGVKRYQVVGLLQVGNEKVLLRVNLDLRSKFQMRPFKFEDKAPAVQSRKVIR